MSNPLILLGIAISGIGFLMKPKPETEKPLDAEANTVPESSSNVEKPEPALELELTDTSKTNEIKEAEANES